MGLFAEPCVTCGHPLGWHQRAFDVNKKPKGLECSKPECTCKNFVLKGEDQDDHR